MYIYIHTYKHAYIYMYISEVYINIYMNIYLGGVAHCPYIFLISYMMYQRYNVSHLPGFAVIVIFTEAIVS